MKQEVILQFIRYLALNMNLTRISVLSQCQSNYYLLSISRGFIFLNGQNIPTDKTRLEFHLIC